MIAKSLLTLLLLATAQTPPPQIDPTIAMSGPKQRALGHSVRIKIAIKGNDLKVTSTANADQWYVVTLFNSNDLAIVFDPEAEGTYTFAAAVNGNNKTAVGIWSVQIGAKPPEPPTPNPPGPVPIPNDPMTQRLQAAWAQDGGTADQRKKLSAAYTQGAAQFIPASKINNDLLLKQKTLNEQMIGQGACPNLRRAIATEVVTVLGTNPQDALDAAKATTLWNNIAASLNKITP